MTEQKRMTYSIEADAAALLPQMAGSVRKQGALLSRLIRAAAEGRPAENETIAELQRGAFQSAVDLLGTVNELLHLSGQSTRAMLVKSGGDNMPPARQPAEAPNEGTIDKPDPAGV